MGDFLYIVCGSAVSAGLAVLAYHLGRSAKVKPLQAKLKIARDRNSALEADLRPAWRIKLKQGARGMWRIEVIDTSDGPQFVSSVNKGFKCPDEAERYARSCFRVVGEVERVAK